MSERREQLIELRTKLLKGDPPFDRDPVLGVIRRDKGGLAGLEERQTRGDHDANASGIRLVMQILLELIDLQLERTR